MPHTWGWHENQHGGMPGLGEPPLSVCVWREREGWVQEGSHFIGFPCKSLAACTFWKPFAWVVAFPTPGFLGGGVLLPSQREMLSIVRRAGVTTV